MTEKHPGWQEFGDEIAAGLRRDYADGVVFDPQELAERTETYYLAARERAKPTSEQAEAANWARVKAAVEQEYGS